MYLQISTYQGSSEPIFFGSFFHTSLDTILFLQFGEDICGACHAIRFKIDQWLDGYEGIEARYVDIKKNLELCSQMGIFSVPTVMVYMDGRLVARESGYFSLEAVFKRIEYYFEIRRAMKNC